MTTMSAMNGGPAALRLSGDRMMAAAASGRLDTEALAAAAAFRTIAAWTLAPAPRDPRAHVWAAHAEARPYLTRLTRHAADHEVASVITADLFRRLTRRPAAGDTAGSDRPTTPKPAPDPARYTYTPRKVLRRVLDHALDHLNRIDQAIRLLGQRADKLTDAELDWAPPDGGWSLRRVVHHVARCERLYATALDEAPAEDPLTRYQLAGRLLEARLQEARDHEGDTSVVYVNLYGVFYTPETAAREAVALERGLVEERRAEAAR